MQKAKEIKAFETSTKKFEKNVKKSLHFVNDCCILHIVLMKNTG